MKKSIWMILAAILSGLLVLGACQVVLPTTGAPASQATLPPTPIPLPTVTETPAAPPPTPTADFQPTPTAEGMSDPAVDPAVQTVQDYFAALERLDYKAAADLLSTFSLSVDGMTHSDGADELHKKILSGMEWSDLQVLDTQVFSDKVRLVHVTYTVTTYDVKTSQSTQTQMDELWPVTLENKRWLYDRNNLIDFHTLSIPDQSMGGLRIKPLELARFSDRMRLTMLVQNTTNETIVLGQVNEILATFSFGDQQVQAEHKQLIFGRLRSYSDATIEVKGLFKQYPDSVVIRQWKNLKVAPWFDFRFSE